MLAILFIHTYIHNWVTLILGTPSSETGEAHASVCNPAPPSDEPASAYKIGDFVHTFTRQRTGTGEKQAYFYAGRIKSFMTVDGEPGVRLRWYHDNVQDMHDKGFSVEDVFAPAPPTDRHGETTDFDETVRGIAKINVKEGPFHEGSDGEFVVFDVEAIVEAVTAVTADAAEEQNDEARQGLQNLLGVPLRESRPKRRRSDTRGLGSLQGETDKENTDPNRGQVRVRDNVMQCSTGCKCLTCVRAILSKRPRTVR